MKISETSLAGVFLVEPKSFGDARGYFMETFKASAFEAAGLPTRFCQDNFSKSAKGILRGLHLQRSPKEQAKLVRVTVGAVLDVAVDLRLDSPNFGKWIAVELNEENKKALYIPQGFGHGFLVLSEVAHFEYKCTQEYDPASETGVLWNDPELGIRWGAEAPLLSDKDRRLLTLAEFRGSK